MNRGLAEKFCVVCLLLGSFLLIIVAIGRARAAHAQSITIGSGTTPALMLNILSCGAVGDGAADDTAAFSACIAKLSSGGAIFLPAGSYKLTSTIAVATIGITVQGTGYGSKLLVTHTNDAFNVTAALFKLMNVEVQINTSSARTGKAVLHFQAGQGTVNDVRVTGNNSSTNNGYAFLQDSDSSDNWFYTNILVPGGATWTSVWRATAVTGTVATTQITNSHVVNAVFTTAAIDIDGAIDTFLVSNCDFPTYGGYAIWAHNSVGAASGFPRYLHFTNVSVEGGNGGGAPTTAVKVDTAFDFRFVGGYIASAAVGLAAGSGVQYMDIAATHFVSFQNQAITVDAAAQGVTITSNTFMDASQASSGAYDDILVNGGALNVNISMNFFNTSAATKPANHINLATGATNQYSLIGNRQGASSTTVAFVTNNATGSNRTIVGNPGVVNTFSGDQSTFNTQVNLNSGAPLVVRDTTNGVQNDSGNLVLKSSTNNVTLSGATVLQNGSVTFAALPTPSNGMSIYCSDCTIANPCASGGSGAFAQRINGVWVCDGGLSSAGSERDWCVYNAANLGAATAIGETTVTNASTVTTGGKITTDIAGSTSGNFVVMLCTDGTTCAAGNQRATWTQSCTAAAGVRTAPTVQNSGTIAAGTTITISVTTACNTADPGANICAHFTTP